MRIICWKNSTTDETNAYDNQNKPFAHIPIGVGQMTTNYILFFDYSLC